MQRSRLTTVLISAACILGLAGVVGAVAVDEDAPHRKLLAPTTVAAERVQAASSDAESSAPSTVLASDAARTSTATSTAVIRPLVEYPLRDFDLSEVRWTAPKSMRISDLASQWGMSGKELRKLNPSLRGRKRVSEGDSLRVYEEDPASPPRSVGAPNRGKLRHGVPLPEGDAWRLRQRRVRVYGGTVMVETLLLAFEAFAAEFPDADEIRLGDLSDRNGGRLHPHASHRTGRDVDIGYILHPEHRGERYWQHADEDSFDVEKNWFLIKALIETGNVQQIFMSSRLQKLILPMARRELSAEQMALYFRRANPDPRSPSLIKHWKGHLDHMHVRFRCEPGNAHCVSRSR